MALRRLARRRSGTRRQAVPVHHWELYRYGQQIDLDPFGTSDMSFPMAGLPGREPNEERD